MRKYISIFCLNSYFDEAKKPTRITTHCYSCKCNFSLSDLRTDNKGARAPHHKVILGKCGIQWKCTIDSQMWSSALKIDKNMRFVGNPFNGFHAITSSWLVWFPIVFSGFLSLLQSLCHGSWNLKHVLWHVPILYVYIYIYRNTRVNAHICCCLVCSYHLKNVRHTSIGCIRWYQYQFGNGIVISAYHWHCIIFTYKHLHLWEI